MRKRNPQRPNRYRFLVGSIALSLSLMAHAQPKDFSIPEGDLVTALEAYMSATGVQLVYRTEDVKGRRSPGVKGSLAPDIALKQLLDGTQLDVKRDGSGAVVVFSGAASAEAANSQGDTPSGQTLETVIVTGKAISHLGERNRTGTRTDTDPMDLPQSVTTVKRELIEQQQASNLRQVLQNVAGVVASGSSSGFSARGFDASVLRNGSLADNSSTRSELPTFAIESVEVVRGPESVISGQAAGYGGVINVQTKTANGERVREAQLRLGSRNQRTLGLDIGDTLSSNPSVSLRLVGQVERNGATAAGYRGAESNYFAPSLSWENRSSGTTVLADVALHRSRTPYASIVFSPTLVSEELLPARLPVPNAGDEFDEQAGSLTLSQTLGKRWSMRFKAEKNHFERAAIRPLNFQELEDTFPLLPIDLFEDRDITETDSQRVELLGSVTTANIDHRLMLGLDNTSNNFKSSRFRTVGSFDFDLTTGASEDTSAANGYPEEFFEIEGGVRKERGLILQNQWYWGEQWAGLLAARNITVDSFGASYTKWLPSFGLVYRATPELSIFASHSEAAQSNATLLTIEGNRLPDEFAESREVGFKSILADGNIALSGSLYEIQRVNAGVPDFDNDPSGQAYRIVPTVRSRGLELEASGQFGPKWDWRAGTSTNRTTDSLGEPQGNFPERQYTAYVRYSFGEGWWSSVLLTHQSASEIGRKPRQQIDLGLGYEARNWSVTAALKSAASKRLLETGGTTSALIDQERELSVTASLKF